MLSQSPIVARLTRTLVGLIALSLALSRLSAVVPVKPTAALVDLNTATKSQLLKVPGMTVGWAERIVRYRPYRTKLDLVELGILTPDAYRRIREGVIAHHLPGSAQAGTHKRSTQIDPTADTR